MSREVPLQSASSEKPDDSGSDEITLQISLRLSLDQVAEASAADLRAKAPNAPSRQALCQLACRIYDARRTRDKMLDRQLFGEPAWDMLLALYCLPARGEILSVTALAHAADVAQSTGHRWQTIMTKEGLIERGPQGVDARRQSVRLTKKGRELMQSYLSRLYFCATPVPPYPDAAGG